MQSQGSAKTFTLYLGGIKAERRTSQAALNEARNTCLDRLEHPRSLATSASPPIKWRSAWGSLNRRANSLRSQEKGSPAEHKAGLNLAVARVWLVLHESGTFVRFTQAGVELFA
jgi:hypothetical protein